MINGKGVIQNDLKIWALAVSLLAIVGSAAIFLVAMSKADADAGIHTFLFADRDKNLRGHLYIDQGERSIEWHISSLSQIVSLIIKAETVDAPIQSDLVLCDHSCNHVTLGLLTTSYPSNRIQALLDRPAYYGLQIVTSTHNVTIPMIYKN